MRTSPGASPVASVRWQTTRICGLRSGGSSGRGAGPRALAPEGRWRSGSMTDGRPGPLDLHLFNEGRHRRLYDALGAHLLPGGTSFAVWAPNARSVSVVHDGNGWQGGADTLAPVASSGIWHGFVPGAGA